MDDVRFHPIPSLYELYVRQKASMDHAFALPILSRSFVPPDYLIENDEKHNLMLKITKKYLKIPKISRGMVSYACSVLRTRIL